MVQARTITKNYSEGTLVCIGTTFATRKDPLTAEEVRLVADSGSQLCRKLMPSEVLLAYSWRKEEIANPPSMNHELAANTICPNPFEAFMAAALLAMGKPEPHAELMRRLARSNMPVANGRVRLISKMTSLNVRYQQYERVQEPSPALE